MVRIPAGTLELECDGAAEIEDKSGVSRQRIEYRQKRKWQKRERRSEKREKESVFLTE